MNDKVYLKIYTEDNDNVLVFEGQGAEDVDEIYYPTRVNKEMNRFGTTVIGANHITITKEAKEAFERIVLNAQHTNDDVSWIDIYIEVNKDIVVSYIGDIITKFNINDCINDEKFFIGCGAGAPDITLLEEIPLV